MADNVFGGKGAGYATSLMTLRGPNDNRKRRRLQPGMRLADGTVWTGDSQVAGMEKAAEDLEKQILALQLKLADTYQKIKDIKGVTEDVALVSGTAETLPQGNKVMTKKGGKPKPQVSVEAGEEKADVGTVSDRELHADPEPEDTGV